MKIAILGSRGIPAAYGGFETLAEELSARLVQRGHQVLVYCRRRRVRTDAAVPKGVRRVFLPAVYTKHLETISHGFFCVLHQCLSKEEAVLVLNNVHAILLPLLKIFKKKVYVHVDGLEWRRSKWGALARAWHKVSEGLAARWADGLISDSHVIADYYAKTHARKPEYAAYGMLEAEIPRAEELRRFDLEKEKYLLWVGRMEPENNPEMVVQAFSDVLPRDCPHPLIMLGWAPYSKQYEKRVRALADDRVRFLGGVYGRDYRLLLAHCKVLIHASAVGGTHPVLVEAMGLGRPILSSDIPENRETLGGIATYFALRRTELAATLLGATRHPEGEHTPGGFRWDDIVISYEDILR